MKYIKRSIRRIKYILIGLFRKQAETKNFIYEKDD